MMEQANQLVEAFNRSVKEHFAHRRASSSDIPKLHDAMEYSLLSGGKRFRPLLCFAVAEAVGLNHSDVTPFAMAVESVHTYSLIHDDLPCMDDDAERRGLPTNHIKFGEDVALLAGDALLTEAFYILAKAYPDKCSDLTSMVSEASGLMGMIRGQVLDLGHGNETASLSDLIHLHEMKTGQLIALCFAGPAVIAGNDPKPMEELGFLIGLAFQVKDDLLDVEDGDLASFISFLGVEGTQSHLQSLTEKIHAKMDDLDLSHPFLRSLIDFNLNRDH